MAERQFISPLSGRPVRPGGRAAKALESRGYSLRGNQWVQAPPLVQVNPRTGARRVRNPITGRMIGVDERQVQQLNAAGWVLPPLDAEGRQPGFVPRAELIRESLADVHDRDALIAVLNRASLLGQKIVSIQMSPGEPSIVLNIDQFPIGSLAGAYNEYLNGRDGYDFDHTRRMDLLLDALANGAFRNATVSYGLAEHARGGLLYAAGGYCLHAALVAWAAARGHEYDFTALREPQYEVVDEKDMQTVADRFKLDIRIYSQVDELKPCAVFAAKRLKASKPRVVPLWAQANHLILLPQGQKGKVQPIRWASQRDDVVPEIVQKGDKARLERLVRESLQVEPTRLITSICDKSTMDLLGFVTPTRVVKIDHPLLDLAPRSWGPVGAALELSKLKESSARSARHRDIRRNGMVPNYLHFQRMGFSGKEAVLYDQVRAFASFAKCPMFAGWPDWRSPAQFLRPNPILEEAILFGEIEGVALVRRPVELQFPLQTCIRDATGCVTFPTIRLAKSRGHAFEILGVFSQAKTLDDPFAHFSDAVEDDKRMFNALVGRLSMHEGVEHVISTSPQQTAELGQLGFKCIGQLHKSGDGQYVNPNAGEQVTDSSDSEDTAAEKEARAKRKKKTKTRKVGVGYAAVMVKVAPSEVDPIAPLIAAYVRSYQEISMYIDVLGRIDQQTWERVGRVWVDGVYVVDGLSDEHETYLREHTNGRWHDPEVKKIPIGDGEQAVPSHYREEVKKAWDNMTDALSDEIGQWEDDAVRLRMHRRLFITGGPGSGKSTLAHAMCNADGSQMLSGSTHLAVKNLSTGSPGPSCTTARLITLINSGNPAGATALLQNCDRLFIDEVSMLDQNDLTTLAKLCDDTGTAIVCVGDLFQIPPVSVRGAQRPELTIAWMKDMGFYIERLRGSKRAEQDPGLVELCAQLEILIENNDPTARETVQKLRQKLLDACVQVSAKDETPAQLLKRLGKETIWATGTRAAVETVNKASPSGYVRIVGNRIQRPQRSFAPNERIKRSVARQHSIPASSLVEGRACTFHGVQGDTLDHPIVVDIRAKHIKDEYSPVWDARQLYVGATRTRRLDQIVLYVD